MEASIHPIDVSTLKKGDVITADQIEQISGRERGTQQYQFAVLGLREWIKRQLVIIGSPMMLKIEGDSIRMLTDQEASPYAATRFRTGMRIVANADFDLENVDVTKLTDEQRVEHDRRKNFSGFVLNGMMKAKHQFEHLPESHRRTLPGPKAE